MTKPQPSALPGTVADPAPADATATHAAHPAADPAARYAGTSAAAFTLAPGDAARALGLTATELADLVRTGRLPTLLGPFDGSPPVRFAPDVLAAFATAMAEARVDAATLELMTASRVLRRYLEQAPPVADYGEAVEMSAPLLSRARSREVYAHVSAKAFAERMRRETGDLVWRVQGAADAERVLRALGCVKVRGIRALDSPQRQRWSWWFRVPLSLWSLEGSARDPFTAITDWPALGRSSREPGELAHPAPDGTSYVHAPPEFGQPA
jgi:hypothetical protein